MGERSDTSSSPRPIVISCRSGDLEDLLTREWIRSNRLGAYSSSTVVGCNTRRYHGLLVAATNPPVGRVMALSTVMEQAVIGGQTYDLATNEFPGTFSPRGAENLVEFRDDVAATFVYAFGETVLTKRVLLSDSANAVLVRYEVRGPLEELRIRPFTSLRDYHGLRSVGAPHEMTSEVTPSGVVVSDRRLPIPPLRLQSPQARFEPDPQWWYRQLFRVDLGRGQDGTEDIYSPGLFVWRPGRKSSCKLTASLDEGEDRKYKSVAAARRKRRKELIESLGPEASRADRRLAAATDLYIVDRTTRRGGPGASILAGFPWFADWGRDAFIALPGLLLCTKQFDLARKVFATYADCLSEGMIPNCFDEHGGEPHYNSVDASLWFLVAGERYLRATDDQAFQQAVMLPAGEEILTRYAAGTRFGIHADADGLLWAGSYDTQLTWMDAKLSGEAITPRWGKAVEVNALWYCAHRILADRLAASDPAKAERFDDRADQIASSFAHAFWNDQFGWLNDVVNSDGADASLRPNQIFAVSLPHSPLKSRQQQAVVQAVSENLLTPFGLRTLSPQDRRYRSRYGGCVESRDRAYHNGTAWAYLAGAYVEAYLKVEDAANNPEAVRWAKVWLLGFDGHLAEAGLGHISEIFDGSEPHVPRGCFAQAWSVAEVLRAKMLVAEYEALHRAKSAP